MAIIVPNTGSTFGSAACVVGSENHWVWLGFRTTIAASGSATFYRCASPVSGSEILAIALGACFGTEMFGPFNSPSGIYINGVTGGCAIVWMKAEN